jgi:hypothetical protein
MIRPYDTLVLATTKLRTRRLRTLITIILAGLLFGVLVAALTVARGAVNSIQDFSKEGLNDRYIVQATTDPPLVGDILENKDIQARAQQIYEQTIAAKKAAAKRLGIEYDPTTEQSPFLTFPGVSGQAQHQYLSPTAPAAQQTLQEWVNAHPSPTITDLKKAAAPYNPMGYYQATYLGQSSGVLATMQNGVENFDQNEESISKQTQQDILQTSGLAIFNAQLTKPFMLPASKAPVDPNAVPIVIPYSKAETLLGLKSLPKSASASEHLARIRELYAKANTITMAACFRNGVSATQISTALSQAADIAKNAGNKDYQKPSLIYGLPSADSCGQATVVSDTRTKDEKTLAAKQDQFTKEFGGTVDPVQQKIVFRVVGLTPDPQNGESKTSIAGILQDIVGSSLQGVIAVPDDMFDKLPNVASLKSILLTGSPNILSGTGTASFVEFHDADAARSFINEKTCTTRPTGSCATPDKPFQLSAFGSNSIALKDLQRKFAHFFKLAALGVVAMAIIILTGTIGRMIADGRRETAVFRATGAKRLDIAMIYGLYTLLLSCIVAAAALALGLIAALMFDHHYWQSTTLQAKLLFGASQSSRTFRFFGIDTRQTALVLLAAIGAGLVSMLFPIIRNVRRNPIKDMREE